MPHAICGCAQPKAGVKVAISHILYEKDVMHAWTVHAEQLTVELRRFYVASALCVVTVINYISCVWWLVCVCVCVCVCVSHVHHHFGGWIITLEVGSRGFLNTTGFQQLYRLVQAKASDRATFECDIVRHVVLSSYDIWCKRNWCS